MGMFGSMESFQRSPDIEEVGKSIEKEGVKNPNEIFVLAKKEAGDIFIRPEDRNSEGKLLVSPGGPESNLSEEYWKLVRTPSFKKWFSDSNVVDENGEPALLYHKTHADVASFNHFSKESKNVIDPAHYFSSGDHDLGKNRLSVFINAKVKKVEKFKEIHRFTKDQKQEINSEGYEGVVYDVESAEKELSQKKEEFRQEHAPRTVKDYIFYGYTKLNNFFTRIKSDPKEDLGHIKSKMRFIQTLDNPLYQLVIFDGNNAMIVNKEEDYKKV